MKNSKRIRWITQTAVFIALLIAVQVFTAPFGNIFVTGSVVNMLLAVSVMTCGLNSGITVSLLSPVLAKFLGIGPLWSIIPFIVLGNIAFIMTWHFIGRKLKRNRIIMYAVAIATASVVKFLILYFCIAQLAVTVLLKLPEQQAALISGMFSIPQLITALIGGMAAAAVLPALRKYLKTEADVSKI